MKRISGMNPLNIHKIILKSWFIYHSLRRLLNVIVKIKWFFLIEILYIISLIQVTLITVLLTNPLNFICIIGDNFDTGNFSCCDKSIVTLAHRVIIWFETSMDTPVNKKACHCGNTVFPFWVSKDLHGK